VPIKIGEENTGLRVVLDYSNSIQTKKNVII
jgi:hypothetical protein